jgi:branched-chain amino acid transport system permease protein
MATIAEQAVSKTSLPGALKEAAITAAVALVLAFPMIGLHLGDIPGGVTVVPQFGIVAITVAVVFFGRLAMALYRQHSPNIPTQSLAGLRDLAARGAGLGIYVGPAVVVFAVVMPFMPFADGFIMAIAITVLIYVMLGWGLNIVVGLAGLLDLGYVAFYAVGAYSFALLATNFNLGFWECLPLAGAIAALFGILLGFPVLRLRGDYLAIVTLGFGEMIRIILLNWQDFTGGPNGIGSLPTLSFFGFPFVAEAGEGETSFSDLFGIEYAREHRQIFIYYVILVLALATNFFTLRIRKLPLGRAWEALREDEIACRALGINPTITKLSAFAIGAMFGGFAGSFFATRQGFISPESFSFIESATILAIVVLGGMGSQLGTVLAAAFLVLLPELGREFAQFRMLAFGIAMVLIMIWRPRGLVSHREPSVRLAKRPKAGAA